MMKRRKTYGALPLIVPLLLVLSIGIPIFLFGMGTVIKFMEIMFFTPKLSGGIPIWWIVILGLVYIIYTRNK